jgi:hypothetical protein
LPISGAEFNKKVTVIFNPSFLEIILKGLNILDILKIFIIPKFNDVILNEVIEIHTIKKSIIFHGFLKYDSSPLKINPITIVFKVNSRVKKDVNTASAIFKLLENVELGSVKGLSSVNKIVDISIKNKMKLSN